MTRTSETEGLLLVIETVWNVKLPWRLLLFSIIAGCLVLASCNCDVLPENAPKLIEADGQTYVACEGFIWVSTQSSDLSGASYSVKFTQKDNISRDLRGVKKLDISDLARDSRDLCKPSEQSKIIPEQGYPPCENGYV